jgi:alanine racemase
VRPTWVEVDLAAIAFNVASIRDVVAPARLCAVVKADAYGHGDVPVSEAALGAGADSLAVALAEEGVRLREAGVEAPILLLSEPAPDAAADVIRWRLTPTVYSTGFISALGRIGRPIEVHLKIDTGMHRVGGPPGEAGDLVAAIRDAGLTLAGVWTHFAVADEDPEYTRRQIALFDRISTGIEAPVRHLANTAGGVLFPEARADMVRVGLGIYGLHPCAETSDVVELRPAMRLVSSVTHKLHLGAGERPSYGRIRPMPADGAVVTVPVGYADGFSRLRTGEVLVGGRRFPLAGRVTMDQIVVDVGGAPVSVGDDVVLLGRQGDEEITADEWALELGTVAYEIVCSIGPRVPRRYTR